MDLTEIRKKLKKELDKDRYEHTKGVMYTAACMAMAFGYDIEKAMIAGLLHDCAKCIANDEKIRICEAKNIPISEVEYNNPTLLHAKLGAYYAKHKYKINDKEICHAIAVHTTGEPEMNLLDKIIFIADYIEPKRDKAPNLEDIRKAAFFDLDLCTAMICRDTVMHLNKMKGSSIDPATELTNNYYKQFLKED